MDSSVVKLLVLALTFQALWCMSDSRRQYQLTIGVYGMDERWETIIRHVWYNNSLNSTYDERFVYITSTYPHTLHGINQAREYLQSMEIGVVLGPYSSALQLATHDLQIPYLVTTQPDDVVELAYTYYLLPQDDVVHQAVLDIITVFKWSKVGIIYDRHQGLHMMEDVLEHGNNKLPVQSWRVSTNEQDLRRKLISIREQSIYHLVVVCTADTMAKIFDNALSLSMMTSMYSWIPVTLNPYAVDLSPYTDTRVNLTAVELKTLKGVEPPDSLHFDALKFVGAEDAHSLLNAAASSYVRDNPCAYGTCTINGTDIHRHLNSIVRNPKANHVTFSEDNRRNSTTLTVLSLSLNDSVGLIEIGKWESYESSSFTRLQIPSQNKSIDGGGGNPFGKRKMRVVAIRDPPFVMYSSDYQNRKGKHRFEGFLIDMMEELAIKADFQYDIYEVPDGNYGKRIANDTWNGMIQELILAKADMCIGAISITSEREEVVDFTKPFMQKSYNLLIKKPKEKTSIFQFLWPLSQQVWLLIISALIVLGVLLYIMDRISPNSDNPSNRFNLTESLWFIYASLVGAGTDLVPRTISGRLLSGAWWFFSLILISSYTANLAAFLTVTKINTPINSLQDLVTQNKIRYGTVMNTNAHSFFMSSKLEIFRKMWSHIEITNGLVNDSAHGFARAKEGDYAFIWDTPVNRYITQMHCDVMTVGEPFDQKGYGIGVPRGAPYRDSLTMGILQINEEGIIQQLEDKWWSRGECEAFKETQTGRTKELGLLNVAGVFLVLAVGAALALIICFIEYVFIYVTRKSKMKSRTPNCEVDKDATELRTTLCNSSTDSSNLNDINRTTKSWLFA